MEGEIRPTHFRGVTTVVNILFNCINPDAAFFGQKDAQQATVIEQMVKDLKLNVEIVVSPIVREPDGLAMSSRNIYLSEFERQDAHVLYQSLQYAHGKIIKGEKLVSNILSGMNEIIEKVDVASLDYIKIVEAGTFNQTDKLLTGEEYYILIACKIRRTRLIDNIKITVN